MMTAAKLACGTTCSPFQVPVLENVLRTVLVSAALVLLFRLAGKRRLAGLNTFDFVVIFLLSNVVQNAIIGKTQSLLGASRGP
jgi:uncharacterized membrane protein YcaP (DUF421 family)